MDYVTTLPVQVQVIAVILAVLTLLFLGLYVTPGLAFRIKIGRLLANLKTIKETKDSDPTEVFASDKTLVHLWQEYRDTLHVQKEVNPRTGVQEVINLRSTVPAETFFSTQALVDSRLRTEFFKHLPGIFTGIGIIGTFLGLIQGLQAFDVSENTEVVRASLRTLLHGVYGAFVISAAAITLAMVVTLLEKWIATGLYRKVEELAYLLDSMYESGAGEEYLGRLVKASEDSASQTKILKDALVADLKQVLSELTEQQIKANAAGNQQLGQQIVEGLYTGLKEPLDKISGAVERIGGSHADAISRVLTDSISALTQRIQELFGGQITGINQLQQQTVQALQAAVAQLKQMAASVDAAGQKATDAMATKLTEALGAMETRQQVINERVAEFVESIRSLVRESQSETSQKLQETIAQLGNTVSEMVGSLKEQAERAGQSHEERKRKMTENTTQVVASLGGQIETVLAKVSEISGEIRTSVETMRTATTDAVNRMNSGAETLFVAASDFAKAGQGVTGALTQATNVADKFSKAAGAIATSALTLEGVVADYKATRETLAAMLTELLATVESAKKEATLTADVLSRIEGATTKLVQAQQEADQYLERVSEVLGQSHQEFADNMRKTLGEANRQFYEQLSSATALLREGIQELDATLAEAGARR